MNLALEKKEGNTEGKGENGSEIGWLHMRLPWMACEKGMERLVDGDGSWKSGGIAGG